MNDFIDSHMHVFQTKEQTAMATMLGDTEYDGTLDSVLAAIKKAGLSKGVIVGQIPVAYMMEAGLAKLSDELSDKERKKAEQELRLKMICRIQRRNTWICELGKQHTELVPLITLDPIMGPDLMKQEITDKVLNHGAKGIKLHPPIGRYYPNAPAMWPAYETCVELDIPILFHCGVHPAFEGRSLVPKPVLYSTPKYFEDVIGNFPKLTVQLAHMGIAPDHRFPETFPILYEESMSLAKKCPSVYFDTSTILHSTFSGKEMKDWLPMIHEIGAERILFGTDFPSIDPAVDIKKWQESTLSEKEKKLILGENARRVYKIP